MIEAIHRHKLEAIRHALKLSEPGDLIIIHEEVCALAGIAEPVDEECTCRPMTLTVGPQS